MCIFVWGKSGFLLARPQISSSRFPTRDRRHRFPRDFGKSSSSAHDVRTTGYRPCRRAVHFPAGPRPRATGPGPPSIRGPGRSASAAQHTVAPAPSFLFKTLANMIPATLTLCYNKRTVGGVSVTTVAAGVRAATGDARGRETLTGGVGRGEAG